jgi:hypothetical protein
MPDLIYFEKYILGHLRLVLDFWHSRRDGNACGDCAAGAELEGAASGMRVGERKGMR